MVGVVVALSSFAAATALLQDGNYFKTTRIVLLSSSQQKMPGQSVGSVAEDVARSRSGWPHWPMSTVEEEGEEEESDAKESAASSTDSAIIRDLAHSTVGSLESALDALETISLAGELTPGLRERVRRASERLDDISS